MPTSTEIFINAELPKRPYTNQFPFTAGHVPVATGVGLETEARALTTSDISDISSYATQEDLSNVLADANEYADGLVVGLWDDRGAYTVNAAGNINYPSSAGSGVAGALMKGDIFTVAGAVAGISTINNIAVNNGDTVRALVDNPGATNDAHWAIAENNIGYIPENTANKTTNTDLSGATGTYPDTPTVKSYIDNYDISAASIDSTGTVTLTRTESDLTFQVPTAISGLSFDANTGVLTSSYTNNATSTTITVAANQVSDNVFRIKDNDDATKKIAFEASGIATGQTRTITMPDSNVNLGLVGSLNSIKITPVNSGSITLQSNKLYHLDIPLTGVSSYTFILPSTPVSGDIIEIHDSICVFGASTSLIFMANKNFTFPIGVTGSVSGSAPNIQWTDTRRATSKRWKFTYFSDYGGFWRVEESDSGGCRSPELSVMRKANSIVGVVPNIDAVSSTNKTITYPNRDVDLGLVGQTNFLDSTFTISDNSDPTKKIVFQASGINTGKTKAIVMGDADVNIGNMMNAVSVLSNTTHVVPDPGSSSTLSQRYHYIAYGGFSLDASYAKGAVWITNVTDASITVSLTGLPAYMDDAGTAITSCTVYAGESVSLTQSGMIITVRRYGSVNSNTFRVYDGTTPSKRVSFNVSGIDASSTKVITMPNANVNLGDLPSVATTDNNTLSVGHLRCRILGGSGNTVSGTDNIAIGTKDFMLSSDSQVAIGAGYRSINSIERVTCADTLILGNEAGYTLTVVHRLRALGGIGAGVFTADTTYTPFNDTLGLRNTPKAVLKRSYFLNARHELTFTATVYSSVGVKAGTISGVRVFGVHYGVGSTTDTIGDYIVTSVTPYADLVNGNCSAVITASIAEVSGTKEKLLRVHIQAKDAAGSLDYLCNSTAELVSHYRIY